MGKRVYPDPTFLDREQIRGGLRFRSSSSLRWGVELNYCLWFFCDPEKPTGKRDGGEAGRVQLSRDSRFCVRGGV